MTTAAFKWLESDPEAHKAIAISLRQRGWNELEHLTLLRMRRNLDRARRIGGNFEAMQLLSELDDDLKVLEAGDPKENERDEYLHSFVRGQMRLEMGTTPQVSA